MSDWGESRERLRLDLETFLRGMHGLGENRYSAIHEMWDARTDQPNVYMGFNVDGLYNIYPRATRLAFDEWRMERHGVTVTPARMPASAYVGGGGAENNRGEHAGS